MHGREPDSVRHTTQRGLPRSARDPPARPRATPRSTQPTGGVMILARSLTEPAYEVSAAAAASLAASAVLARPASSLSPSPAASAAKLLSGSDFGVVAPGRTAAASTPSG